MGVPVVLSTNGIGFPVRPTAVNAPAMSLSSNGFGMPIILDNRGTPFVVQDFPPVNWNMQPITMTAGTNGQHVGYSTGGATLPQPAFGSISGQPTSITPLLAFYNDTASGRYLAVFQGDYLLALVGLKITIGGFPITSYEAELIGGNTWLRFTAGLGNLTPGAAYELVFTPVTGVGQFPQTSAILGAGGLDYALYDSGLASSLFQDAAGTTPAVLTNPVGRWNVRDKTPHFASQSVANQRPFLQSSGLKFDGSDDFLGSAWFGQAGNNCIIAQVEIPAAISATQVIVGSDTSELDRFFLGVNTAGQIRAGAGNLSFNGSGADLRNTAAIIALSRSAIEDAIFVNGSQVYTGAPIGSINSTRAFLIGAALSVVTPANFFGGSIKKTAFGKVALSPAQFQTIRNEWLAAA